MRLWATGITYARLQPRGFTLRIADGSNSEHWQQECERVNAESASRSGRVERYAAIEALTENLEIREASRRNGDLCAQARNVRSLDPRGRWIGDSRGDRE